MIKDVKGNILTWGRDSQRSVIDFVLVSDKLYDKFVKMKIDEEKEQFDISAHNLVKIYMDIKINKKTYKGEEWEVREYYKIYRLCKDTKKS